MNHNGKEAHGLADQLNIYTLDVESDVTSFGKHNRLVVFLDNATKHIEIREDIRGLPSSTEKDRQRVARGCQRLHPRGTRLRFVSSDQWTDIHGHCHIDHVYDIVF